MLLDYFHAGGLVMWPILATSVAALAVGLNRLFFAARIRGDPVALRAEVLRLVDAGRLGEARARCAGDRRPGAAVLSAGLGAWDLAGAEVERRMEVAASDQVARAEFGLPLLATLTAVLPMLGFLGTIVGLIGAFEAWAQAGENVRLEDLSSGIAQAMITTAAGLGTAIPYLIAHNALAAWVARLAREVNAAASDLAGRRLASEAPSLKPSAEEAA